MSQRYKYIFLIVLFVIVGFLHVYPDLRFINELGDEFQGIAFMGAADENVYLSRIAGVAYRDDLRLANAGIQGHKDAPIFQPSLSEVIEGTIAKWLGLSVWQVDIWATFLLPMFLCYLFYIFAAGISGSFKAGVLAMLAVVVGYYWITPNIKSLFDFSAGRLSLSLLFVRPISPQFHFIPFVLSLYFIFKVADSTLEKGPVSKSCICKKTYFYTMLSGLTVGSLFYMSIFYWSFIYSGLMVLAIIDLLRGKIQKIKNYFVIFVISGLISIPYWMSFKPLNALPYFDEIFRRGGGVYTYQPIVSLIEVFCVIFLSLLLYMLPKKKSQLYYMLAFVVGGMICLNQQVITGKTVEPFHWQSFTNKIFIIICFFVCISFILERFKQAGYCRWFISLLKRKIVFICLCFMFLAMGLTQQNLYYASRSEDFRKYQVMAPVLKYIHKVLPADSVILTDPLEFNQERFISVTTKNYPYTSSSFFTTSSISLEEIEKRYFAALDFFGYGSLEAEVLFNYMDGGVFRGMQVHLAYGGTEKKNQAYINSLKQQYARLIENRDIRSSLRRLAEFKVDYLLIKNDSLERFLSRGVIDEMFLPKYNDGFYSVYQIGKI